MVSQAEVNLRFIEKRWVATTLTGRVTPARIETVTLEASRLSRGKYVKYKSLSAKPTAKGYWKCKASLKRGTYKVRALTQAGKSTAGLYQYTDTALQHGTTYEYGIIAVKTDSSEGEMALSPVQVVAP